MTRGRSCRTLLARTALAVLAGLMPLLAAPPAHAASFRDVGQNDWFAEAVRVLSAEDVVNGKPDGTFGPYDPITRAEFSVWLSRALDLPPESAHPFRDFPLGSWYVPDVAALVAAGLINGVSPTAFDPEGKISRQQAAGLIVRALEFRLSKRSIEGVELVTDDAEIVTWLRGFVDWSLIADVHRATVANAYRLQIVSGRADGRFAPLDEVTRAQTAVMLYSSLFKTPIALADPPAAPPASQGYRNAAAGSQGSDVLWLEQRLADLTYRPGPVDGVFDRRTAQAVIAFQKWEGLSRTGVVEPRTWERLAAATRPTARMSGSGVWVEVDKSRQVFLYVEGGAVTRTLPTSTGRTFTYRTAPYTVQRKAIPDGPRYRALYLNPGNVLAIHGYPSVPTYPASDGCIRLPKWDMDDLRAQDLYAPMIPDGTRVYIY